MPKKTKSKDTKNLVRMNFTLDQNDSDVARRHARMMGCYNETTNRYQWQKFVGRLIALREMEVKKQENTG